MNDPFESMFNGAKAARDNERYEAERFAKGFDESKHSRDKGGKFSGKSSGTSKEVKTRGGKTVRTADNPMNLWVRSLDDGKWHRTE